MECDHQTDEEPKLKKHMELAHRKTKSNLEYKCKDCAHEYSAIWSLMTHRRDTHGKSKKKCRNKADNSCKYGPNNGEKCWYDHTDSDPSQTKSNESNDHKCKTCELKFSSKSKVLNHRKLDHPDTVPQCNSIKENKMCDYNESCRLRHEATPKENLPAHHVSPKISKPPKNPTQHNFWETQSTMKPPEPMEEIKNMIQIMMQDISQLKQKVNMQ